MEHNDWRVLFKTPSGLPDYYPLMLSLLEAIVPIPHGWSPMIVLIKWLAECWRRALIRDGRDVLVLIRYQSRDWGISKKETGRLLMEFGYESHIDIERFILEECQ